MLQEATNRRGQRKAAKGVAEVTRRLAPRDAPQKKSRTLQATRGASPGRGSPERPARGFNSAPYIEKYGLQCVRATTTWQTPAGQWAFRAPGEKPRMDTPDRKLMCAARVAKRCDAQLSSDAPPDVDGSWRFKLWAEPDAEALAIAKKRLPEQDPGAPKYVHKPSLSELVGTAQLNLKARYEDLPAQASKQAFAALDAHFSEEDASRRAKKKLEFVLNPYGTLNAGSEAAAVDIGTMYGCTPQEIIERAADETQVYKMLQEFAAKAGQSLTTVCKKLVAPGSPLMTAIGLKVRLLKAVVREGSALAPRGGGSPEGLPREGGAGTPEAGQALVAQPRQGAARLAMKETLEALRCAATEIDSARAVRAHVFHAKVAALTTEIQALNAAMDRFHHAKLTAVKLSTVEDLDHTQLSSFERMERMAIGSIRDARMRADDVRESLLALEKKFHEQDVADERKGKEIAARMADLRKALFGV